MCLEKINIEQTSLKGAKRPLIESAIGYFIFCSIGFSSRFIPSMFLLFVIYGIAFPLLWGRLKGHQSGLVLTKQNFRNALKWGITAGIVWGAYTYLVFGIGVPLSPLWLAQIAIALPVWFLVMSPFQEFFFRGWLQPRLQSAFGKPVGLVVSSLSFTFWHFFPPLESSSTTLLQISSTIGILSTILAGILFGYIYQRTENIVAPWIAHALGGVVLVLIGMMSFIQYTP